MKIASMPESIYLRFSIKAIGLKVLNILFERNRISNIIYYLPIT